MNFIKKILLLNLILSCNTQANTIETIKTRINMAMEVLRRSYFPQSLNSTINDIEKIEKALEESHKEQEKAVDKKTKQELQRAIRFLESARRKLDIKEEQCNPHYYTKLSEDSIKDFSYDTLIKNRETPKKTIIKNDDKTSLKPYRLLIFIFLAILISEYK